MSKPRPPNAAGPNGLRGGIKTYSTKTVTGPWLESLGGTAGYQRGFTTPDYETEVQHLQKGGLGVKDPTFGSEIPIHDPNLSASSFKYAANLTEEWTTNTKLMSVSVVSKVSESEAKIEPKPRMSIENLENYRKKWSSDPEEYRKLRFTTETRLSGAKGVNQKPVIEVIRPLPGSPKVLETYREQLVQKYGLLAFTVIRNQLGKEEVISVEEFKNAIQEIGIPIRSYEVGQILAFVTKSSFKVNIDHFLHALKGHILEFERTSAERLFHSLSNQSPSLSLDTLIEKIDSEEFPEMVTALQEYAKVYVKNNNNSTDTREVLKLDGFVLMMHDFYSASPELYSVAVKKLWRSS